MIVQVQVRRAPRTLVAIFGMTRPVNPVGQGLLLILAIPRLRIWLMLHAWQWDHGANKTPPLPAAGPRVPAGRGDSNDKAMSADAAQGRIDENRDAEEELN